MSVATSIPCMRIVTKTASVSHSKSSSCVSFSTVRCSQTEGPIRRPVAPSPPSTPSVPSVPSVQPPTPVTPVPKTAAVVEDKSSVVVTLEFQRAKARELQEYFKQKKLEAAAQGPVFGWVPKNEIGNGRWAMFGFAVGLLTEYATGSDFVDQVKLVLSNLGIVDLD